MAEPVTVLSDVMRALDLVGVVANGLLGGAVARRFRLDPVGFAILAIVSALGGGAIRDVLLDTRPIALVDPAYLACALSAAVVAFLVRFEGRRWRQVFPYVDAVALGTWAVVGADKALRFGVAPLPAVLLGVLTAVGGGAVRDMMLGQVPTIFRQSELYATAAFASALTLYLGRTAGLESWSGPLAVLVGGGLCIVARRQGWMLPTEPRWPRRRLGGKAVNRYVDHDGT